MSLEIEFGRARTTNSEPLGSLSKLLEMLWRTLRATRFRITELPTLLLIINPHLAGFSEFERWRYPINELLVERSPLFVALAKSALLEIRAGLASTRKLNLNLIRF